jgi:hypothetical protein
VAQEVAQRDLPVGHRIAQMEVRKKTARRVVQRQQPAVRADRSGERRERLGARTDYEARPRRHRKPNRRVAKSKPSAQNHAVAGHDHHRRTRHTRVRAQRVRLGGDGRDARAVDVDRGCAGAPIGRSRPASNNAERNQCA